MNRFFKILFFGLIIKPIVFIVLGLNLRGHDKLPKKGPAVIVANHNSHLDTIVLMSLYPLSIIHRVRPVAAVDYFLGQGGLLAWLALKCIDIVPMDRSGITERDTLFSECHKALDKGEIIILFPEGSRGKPEQMSKLKNGVFFLLNERNDTKVTPVMLEGLGRSLPKGEALLVPFNCDVIIGESIAVTEQASTFIDQLNRAFSTLSEHCITHFYQDLDEG